MRKRPSQAAAIAIEESAGGIGSLIGRYPREFVGLVMATAAVIAVFANALFLQTGPHPAPIFATRQAVAPAQVVVRPRVTAPAQPASPAVDAPVRNRVQLIAEIQRELTRRGFYDGIADGVWGAKTDAGARDFLQSTGLRMNPEASEDLLRTLQSAKPKAISAAAVAPVRNDPIAELIAPSRRVLAIQRALSDFGYGQIKPTGAYDPETRTAIEKFERDHKLPVTGQLSDRFVRELAAMTGRPLE
ncbi:MAG: peptidoglycan-binding domain-containing protein [Pseudolabrys sp.]|nr:peptidoglycan-binding domain-containing protein [Pseudolabrys sp.]MDP2298086.1 peptidoglycan-binding domain-containing protein [Pseudolabrys sp.]